MSRNLTIRTLASASVVAFTMACPAWMSAAAAEEAPATPPEAPNAVAAQPQERAPAPSGAAVARAKAEERRAAMDAAREKRYADLRASAAELGVDLPETPPWKAAEARMPDVPTPPEMPSRYQRPTPEERDAMRKRREEMREEHWNRMRADAAQRGRSGPQTTPWEDMEARREEMAARIEQYRETIEKMTEEQREAARAVFGQMPRMPQRPMGPSGYGAPQWGSHCPTGGYECGCNHPRRPMMPGYPEAPSYDQGPPPPPARQQGN
ncbi:hypothetical protein G3480_18710 [Thiorhodococcus mannitoliphagus]|uniref:DUF3106 domain-containing protein n=1 Tax=Thiorhodococcus mannitoliphagus TaxID=329406 RepID=A0A6P1DXV7_9GAMM|nr:hypothetical protein [Thiorhodococcus mannitoliphagus]NEX22310.1 hypothetical protein [Thiorhodococcus mannitoliphagus]